MIIHKQIDKSEVVSQLNNASLFIYYFVIKIYWHVASDQRFNISMLIFETLTYFSFSFKVIN